MFYNQLSHQHFVSKVKLYFLQKYFLKKKKKKKNKEQRSKKRLFLYNHGTLFHTNVLNIR